MNSADSFSRSKKPVNFSDFFFVEASSVSMADSEDHGGGELESMKVLESSAGVVEESSSPDALKNTPSNIARLEDVIEHCTARRKYLKQTRSPSDGGDVRWYFCKVPLADNGKHFISVEECSW